MPERALQVIESPQMTEYVPAVAVTIEQARDNFRKLHQVTRELMQKGIDYDTIPGTPKPTLLKPGAEHLLQFFGLGHKVQRVETREDWENGFFYYCYRVTVFKARPMPDGTVYEQVISECEGSANSKEARYAYRWVSEKKLPRNINKDKLEYREKEGPYGPYREYKLPNDDIASIVNTLQKMAIKRALVGATLQATGTSGMFTQDLEDYADDMLPQKPASNQQKTSTANSSSEPQKNGKTATQKQLGKIYVMAKEIGLDAEFMKGLIQERYGKDNSKELTVEEASDLIEYLQKGEDYMKIEEEVDEAVTAAE